MEYFDWLISYQHICIIHCIYCWPRLSIYSILKTTQSSKRSFHSGRKTTLLIIFYTIFILVLDTAVVKIYYVDINRVSENSKLLIFVIIALSSMFGQYFIMEYVKRKSSVIRKVNLLGVRTVHRVLYVIQILVIALFVLLILEMVVTNHYHTMILLLSISINYATGSLILGILSIKFYSWFRSDKNYVLIVRNILLHSHAKHYVYKLLGHIIVNQ